MIKLHIKFHFTYHVTDKKVSHVISKKVGHATYFLSDHVNIK